MHLLQAALGFSPVWWHRRILALDLVAEINPQDVPLVAVRLG